MGLFSRKKKEPSIQKMDLLGVSGQTATLSCLILAGLKEVSLQTTFDTTDAKAVNTSSYQKISSSESTPTLTHGEFSTSGVRAIQSYIDFRGKGNSLNPKKARLLGEQNSWLDICYQTIGPVLHELADGNTSEEGKASCAAFLSNINNALEKNSYILGQLSFTDPNIAAFIIALKKHGVDTASYSNIEAWLSRLMEQMSDDSKANYSAMLSA
ncbi:MAG: hypothetical protein AB8D52_02755 [Gammaproteobacteria bacterium]